MIHKERAQSVLHAAGEFKEAVVNADWPDLIRKTAKANFVVGSLGLTAIGILLTAKGINPLPQDETSADIPNQATLTPEDQKFDAYRKGDLSDKPTLDQKISLVLKNPATGSDITLAEYFTNQATMPTAKSLSGNFFNFNRPAGYYTDFYKKVYRDKRYEEDNNFDARGPIEDIVFNCTQGCSLKMNVVTENETVKKDNIVPLEDSWVNSRGTNFFPSGVVTVYFQHEEHLSAKRYVQGGNGSELILQPGSVKIKQALEEVDSTKETFRKLNQSSVSFSLVKGNQAGAIAYLYEDYKMAVKEVK